MEDIGKGWKEDTCKALTASLLMGPTSNLHPRSTIDKVIICHKDLVINMLSDHVEFPLDGDGRRLVNRSESVQVEGYSKILDLFRCCGGSLSY